MNKVSVIYSQNRYQNVYQALNLLKSDISQKIAGKKNIVIKPNLCVADNLLAVTNIEAVLALLDFLRRDLNVSQNIIIGEGPFDRGGLEGCLRNYGYYEKLKDYNITFVDLNSDESKNFDIKYGKKSLTLKLAKTILDSDFLISICPAKTHDAVITTLSIKNVAVGSMVVPEFPPRIGGHTRAMIHGSFYKINNIISGVAKYIMPSLALIDGTVAMQGDGPVSTDAVDFGLAFASLDPVAADSLCSYLMGFDPKHIGYLYYCDQMGLGTNNLDQIEVLGVKDVSKYQKQFKPHSTYKQQLNWQADDLKSKINTMIRLSKHIPRHAVSLIRSIFAK